MHILFLSTNNSAPWGGSEALWYKCADLSLENKHDVTICVKYWGENEHQNIKLLKQKGAKIIYRDEPITNNSRPTIHDKLRFRLRKHLGIIITPQKKITESPKALRNKIAAKYDVVCVSQGSAYDSALRKDIFEVFENISIPYVTVTHFNYDYAYSLNRSGIQNARFFFRKAKINLFVSESNLNSTKHHICYNIENSKIINNPLNISDRSYEKYPDEETAVFACVARLYCKTKAIDILISVFGGSMWKERNWVLYIYGKGEDEFFLQELIKHHNLENKVFLKGHIDNIDSIWKTSHLLLLPSIFEGMPISLHEAMIKGRACLTTHVAGNSEYIIDGYNGFLSPSPNNFYLSKTLERAWLRKDNWEKMGLSARDSLLKQIDLTPEKTLLEYLLTK